MKAIKLSALLLISILSIQFSYAQSPVRKQNIKVNGNCSQCKKKIEKSALAAGATNANWNVKTKILNVSYDPSVTNPMNIETAIAAKGYDTQDVKASDSAYNKLDECCQYDRKKSPKSKKSNMK
jgi:hypothetical protein